MFKLIVSSTFSAAHRLIDYAGMCERVHGHNWKIKVTVAADNLDKNGMVMDLVELKKQIDACVAPFDHRLINEVPPFDTLNPTSENLAKYLYDYVAARIPAAVTSVEVAEVDDYAVVYQP